MLDSPGRPAETFSVYGIAFTYDYLMALAAGAAVILFFAYRQLNHPSYDLDAEQRRLFAALVPADLGGGPAFFRAYAFYVLTLLTTFLAFSVFLPLIPSGFEMFGLEKAGFDPKQAEFNEASLPLFVSLAMIGLGPSVPILQSVEETFRRMSHRLVGIPGNILDIAQRIRATPVDAGKATTEEKLALAQARDLTHHAEVATDLNQEEIADLVSRLLLAKVWLFSFTFTNRWPPRSVRNRFAHFFDTLHEDIEDTLRVVADANHATREFLEKHSGGARPDGDDENDVRAVAERFLVAQWLEARRRAGNAWIGTSTVIALYAINAPSAEGAVSPLLRDVIMTARESQPRPVLDIIANSILLAFGLVFVVALAGSYLGLFAGGASEELTWSPIWTAITYAVSALFVYAPSSLVAWLARSRRVRRISWIPAALSLARFPTIQYLGVFVYSYVAALGSLCFYSVLIRYLAAADKSVVFAEFFLTDAVVGVIAWSLLGALQGCCLCLWLDVTELKGKIGVGRALYLAGGQAIGFGLVAVIATLIQQNGALSVYAAFYVLFPAGVGLMLAYVTLRSLGRYRESLGGLARRRRAGATL